MRVYEVAKLFNVSNKDLIDVLKKKGFVVKSHMSVLTDEAHDFLNKHYQKKTEELEPQKEKVIMPEVAPIKKEIIKEIIPEISEEKPTKPVETVQAEEPAKIVQEFIVEPLSVGQVAEKMAKPVNDIILTLLRQGIVCHKNQLLDEKSVALLARHYNFSPRYPDKIKKEVSVISFDRAGTHERLPVVVVIGHVDHGKTTLLDYIRKTKVALKEKGGITQHLGAYQAETPQGSIVFIDTPGHEAFSSIRGRGINVADLAILMIAADDSVKPQTIEAIKQIKKTGIPVIVAVNKMDKVDKARIEVVKTDLARYDLLPEDWGGQTVLVPISAKTGQGVDSLLEMIILQSQLMDLRTDINRPAKGFILESKMQKGFGSVATVVCQQGILRIGDLFVAGNTYGKVSSLIDSYGRKIKEVVPSVPVQVAGFNELAHAGDFFEVVSAEKLRALKEVKDVYGAGHGKKVAAENAIKIILKTDSTSSKEAILDSIAKITTSKTKGIHIIHAGIGNISESDVTLAADTGAMIVGLHIKIESNAPVHAQENMVPIKLFDIIYKLIEYLEVAIKMDEPIKLVAKKVGEAIVRKVFAIKDLGVIAGSYVKEGIFSKQGRIIAWRGKQKIGEGPIKSLERDRKPVKEVHAGFEFAFLVSGMDDWQIDDRVECYLDVPKK